MKRCMFALAMLVMAGCALGSTVLYVHVVDTFSLKGISGVSIACDYTTTNSTGRKTDVAFTDSNGFSKITFNGYERRDPNNLVGIKIFKRDYVFKDSSFYKYYAYNSFTTINIKGRNIYDTAPPPPPPVVKPPVVTFVYPLKEERWAIGSTHTFKWKIEDTASVSSVYLHGSIDSGKTWGIINAFYDNEAKSINEYAFNHFALRPQSMRFRMGVKNIKSEYGYDTTVNIIIVEPPSFEKSYLLDTSYVNNYHVRKLSITNPTTDSVNLFFIKSPAWLKVSGDSIYGTPDGVERTDTVVVTYQDTLKKVTIFLKVWNKAPTSVIPVVKEILKVMPEVVMYDLFGKRVLVSKVSGVYFNKSGLITKKCFNVIK